jgi:hypothetical protein
MDSSNMVIEYLTAILIFVTTIYVYLTHKMAKATESSVQAINEQTEAMYRPYVVVEPFVRVNTPFLCLRIKNIGKTAAQNLTLNFDRDFYQFAEKDKNFKDFDAFNKKIDSLPPNSELLFVLAQGWLVLADDSDQKLTPAQFEISAEYQYQGKSVSENHKIDLRPYAASEGAKDLVAEELEKIRKVLEKKA